MKTICENYAANLYGTEPAKEARTETLLLTRIGEDLRHHYSDITRAEQPRGLRDLAAVIDARRLDRTDEA